jgi:hypothetical protein
LDALYANGPVMTQLDQHGYGGFVVLKKDNNEPLKEALALWQEQGPCEQYQDADKKEHLQFWDSDDIETLDTYKGKVRVIRAVVTKPDKEPSRTWCSPSSASARVSSPAERRCKSSVPVGISRTPVLISGSNTGISGMFFDTPQTL